MSVAEDVRRTSAFVILGSVNPDHGSPDRPQGKAKSENDQRTHPVQCELFPQRDRCPACGAQLKAKTDGFGKAYELCQACGHRTYAQRR